ncbi:leucyl-tRNA synthetase [Cavenderia fasciculata]|uniref:leucine--tRNA ligase n=1 Tax=Cavenderia fasciculata TaxID=261658 RepID=F4PG72_CACFS|nr:leucyl-tRNA synthetase [Cavenderia fasciculata]EGG24706.1 leucyl-tRNA synthetase [Cavenderia fasciculata]|eukprot:XP_004362557.1 leucyl-tRNA synthetase [Cavenderia fasciculata]
MCMKGAHVMIGCFGHKRQIEIDIHREIKGGLSSTTLTSSSFSLSSSSSSTSSFRVPPLSTSSYSFYSTLNNNGKYYSLSQFPYPSGNLHMGHVRVYTMSDCVARLKRMQGYDVVHPMGWDAFGLPAENAAIEKNVSPSKWTNSNIDEMRRQFKLLDLEFDWNRELSTCDPSYYRWTQEIFLRLYRAGLATRKIAIVNWDPVDNTVLANEQVDATGRSWRSNAIVERREMKQWYFHITKYADRLADDLQKLDGWPDEVKNMQREWIGRSHGYLLDFKYNQTNGDAATLTAFTTRPETIYGVTFLSVHGKHPVMELVRKQMSREELVKLDDFIQRCSTLKDEDPIIAFDTKTTVTSPYGSTVRLVVSSAVHADYGTGCVMGVPAHNTVDHQVATELGLPHLYVLPRPAGIEESVVCYDQLDQSSLLQNSGQFNGMRVDKAIESMVDSNQIKKHTSYRIRDWLLSRQRYWGTPIPIIHCNSCGEVPVPSDQLPVVLPTDISFTGKGSLLNSLDDWKNCKCPKCGGNAQRETDTMDTFVDSSWYYFRFLDSHNQKEIFKKEIANRLMPVDIYVGGIEHAILHLLYSRFITKFLKDDGLIDHEEPFKVLLIQGLVKAKTYRDAITNKPLHPSSVNFDKSQPINASNGNPVNITIEKMSKSKLNGMEPSEMISQYGSDILKLYILFKAPPEKSLEWDTEGIEGCRKWLKRVETLVKSFVDEYSANKQSFIGEFGKVEGVKPLRYETHSTIDNVTQSIEKYTFNTGIAFLMTLSNTLAKVEPSQRNSLEFYESVRTLVILLATFAPNTAQDYWKMLCEHGPSYTSHASGDSAIFEVRRQGWPQPSRECLEQRVKQLVIMTNGKTRAVVDVSTDDQTELEQIAKKHLGSRLDGQTIMKTFFATTKTNNFTINLLLTFNILDRYDKGIKTSVYTSEAVVCIVKVGGESTQSVTSLPILTKWIWFTNLCSHKTKNQSCCFQEERGWRQE